MIITEMGFFNDYLCFKLKFTQKSKNKPKRHGNAGKINVHQYQKRI